MGAELLVANEKEQALHLAEGPYWESFEQFRTVGAKQVPLQLGPEQVGRLNIKGHEFVVMRSQTFSRLYGLAQDAQRLGQAIHLIRQAAQLAFRTPDVKGTLAHLRDLAMFLPEAPAEGQPTPRTLIFAPDEQADETTSASDFDLDPANVRRAMVDPAT
jgi:hypothetical protein